MSSVTHHHIFKPVFSTDVASTTLCNRVDNSSNDANVADAGEVVTCILCLRILAGEKHHNAKWIGWTPDEAARQTGGSDV
ncbi:hypothetical protein [Ochrobactrum sp. Marseille-Q0166]|uniref:hypothetical protein n=1 Tax=Ochrobactrum sp. Marseille-Q0166 TaxID=2761105 RepID=UPI00165503DA|nr:hypothetical protein [Ochrobactrum sp. Marseille-Q0166]MBC8718777.1 hypothetical protein [Ochrobactrum sp. Marseille-Q0166]